MFLTVYVCLETDVFDRMYMFRDLCFEKSCMFRDMFLTVCISLETDVFDSMCKFFKRLRWSSG